MTRRTLYPATSQQAARNTAQNELFAAQRSLKMAQEAKDEKWIKNADLRVAACAATLTRLDAR